MVTFKIIRWKNFLSTGNSFTQLQLDKTKNTLISGENGAGKTTLLDALTFVLFGKPYRNIKLDQLVNSINEKDCVVEIEFDANNIEYKIRRGIAPKLFEVYRQGKLIDQDAKSKDYQDMVEDVILKMNYKAFCQVVILGSTNYVPFMRLAAAERRSIVENLLDINIFSTMNFLLKEKVSTLKQEITELCHRIDIQKEKTESQKRHIELVATKSKESIDKYEREITESQVIMDEYTNQIEERRKTIQGLLDISEQINVEKDIKKLDEVEKTLSHEMSRVEKDIGFYSTNDHCPSCSQKIDCVHKETVITEKNTRKTELEKALQRHSKEMQKLNNKLKEKNEYVNSILREEKEIQIIQNQVSVSSKYVKKLQSDIDEILLDTKNIEEEQNKLKELGSQGKELVQSKLDMSDDMQYYGIASFLMKDSGIKSKIIKYYLPIMNKIINKYLAMMDFFVQFELSESFEETIRSRHRDIFTYDSFSEGEKRKIDLSLLFAWRSVAQLKNSLNCNLLIFDEVLDGSLDDIATESFLSILKGLDKNTNTFVISHKSKELLQDKFEDHITFTKRNNFSKIDT